MQETTTGKRMFADITDPKEKEAALEANCVRPEEMGVKDYYTEQEMTDMRKEYAENSTIIAKKMEEYAKLKAEIMAHIKPAEAQRKYLLTQIRAGFQEVQKQVYLFDDQDNNVMEYYDNTGNFVYGRPLMPTERQTNVISMAIRTGTNN